MQQFVTFLGASFLSKQAFVEKLVKIVKSFQFCSQKLEQNEQIITYFSEINILEYPTLF